MSEGNKKYAASTADVFWNMLGSIISAAASFLLLLFVTRYIGAGEGGVFSLAYSTAQILLTVGKFGVRSFQATDIKNEVSFQVYQKTRMVFCGLMIALDLGYALIAGYDITKTLIFLFVCIMKMVDAIEDVYHGQMQKRGRLALAGKLLAFRNTYTIIIFALFIIFTENLLISVIWTSLSSLILGFICNIFGGKNIFKEEAVAKEGEAKILLKNCFPLFMGTFLSLLIYNVPKYVIDFWGTDEQIACYTILFMPTFVINMFSDFIFKPMLTSMAYDLENHLLDSFIKRIYKLLGGIGALLLFALLAAWLFGCPILSLVYAVDVNDYKIELCVLMIGGGFSAVVYLLYNVLTCMRMQKEILIGYAVGTIAIIIMASLLISQMGILGQTIAYLITEFMLALYMFFVMRNSLRERR